MTHLYLNPETDSIYVDVTAGDGSPTRTVQAADGVLLHLDEPGMLVAVEVIEVGRRGGAVAVEPEMGHLHVNRATDSLYLDVSAGTRSPAEAAAVAEGVFLHVDEAGILVAVEIMNLSQRGGLRVDDLDAVPGADRLPIFDEIERAASARSGTPPPFHRIDASVRQSLQ